MYWKRFWIRMRRKVQIFLAELVIHILYCKSQLSPTTCTVDAVSCVQKEMTNVLNDEDMDVEEKLHIYNQLMSRVLVNKARYMFSPEPNVAHLPDDINEPVTIRGKKWTRQDGLLSQCYRGRSKIVTYKSPNYTNF